MTKSGGVSDDDMTWAENAIRAAKDRRSRRPGSQTMRVLDFIRAEVRAGRGMPSAPKINQHMRWGSGAYDCFIRLATWGRLRLVGTSGPGHLRYEIVDDLPPNASPTKPVNRTATGRRTKTGQAGG